jgi:NADH-quinone oxidoreductase subunit L
MLIAMMGNSSEQRTFSQNEFSWMFAGNLKVDMAFQLDQLSMVFVLLITVVGALIHIYSLGYMNHDPDKRKFFGYLNLFVAAMLLLVLANNYLLLYVGWEGVGLASFLLISFWQIKPTAAAAGKKAFIINRVGDVGLSLAIMVMFVTFGSVGFQEVFGSTSQASEGTLTAIGLLLLLAAALVAAVGLVRLSSSAPSSGIDGLASRLALSPQQRAAAHHRQDVELRPSLSPSGAASPLRTGSAPDTVE